MTKLDGVPDRDDAKPGMAYFAGTGPWDKSCGSCKYLNQVRKCTMFRRLTGKYGPQVERSWLACKYYEPAR